VHAGGKTAQNKNLLQIGYSKFTVEWKIKSCRMNNCYFGHVATRGRGYKAAL
jgi:hypothetical protein